MLAKQLWRLAHQPSSLAYRLLKAKYFPRSDILQATTGYKPSYLWRSLLAAKQIVHEGEAWRIGNGLSVMKMEMDRWIGVENPKRSQGLLVADWHDMKVSALIDEERGIWKHDLIKQIFPPDEAAKIVAIPLSRGLPEDKRIWRLTNHGFFTVRTAYQLALEKFSHSHMLRPSSSVVPVEWKKLWHIEVAPRVKMFIWRACTNAVPTKNNLRRRGSEVDPICVICGEEEENVDHLFMSCSSVVQIWKTSVMRIDIETEQIKSFRGWFWEKMLKYPKEYVGLLAYTIWEISKQRNRVIFDGKNFSSREVVGRAFAQWKEATEHYEKKTSTEIVTKEAGRWKKPQHGEHKLNCDVAVLGDGRIGMGFVIRDENGSVLLAGKEDCIASGGSTVLESIAMRFACRKAIQFRMKVDVIESDSKVLTDSLNSCGATPVYCDVMTEDIKNLARQMGCKQFEFVKRDGNRVAHYAARGQSFLSINHSPAHLENMLKLDISSL